MSAMALKMVACAAMLLDHVGYCFDIFLLRAVGRIAFPVYLFLIHNGYRHTSSPLRYALRLAVFALISQIPYGLFCYQDPFYPEGSAFVTLLVALLCIWAEDRMGKHPMLKWISLFPYCLCVVLYCLGLLRSDYGAAAVLWALAFRLLEKLDRQHKMRLFLPCVFAFFCFAFLEVMCRGERLLVPIDLQKCLPAFSLLALPIIFFYNGQKGCLPGTGRAAKLVQYGFYIFYPLHLMLLWLLTKYLL